MARNGVIGIGNRLPWHLPEDLKRFRKLTLGHTVVMGRKTFESLPGGPLKGRRNVVLSRSTVHGQEGVIALKRIEEVVEMSHTDILFIIGGGEIYRQFLPYTCRIELTYIDDDVDGDTLFPTLDLSEWQLIAEEPFYDKTQNISGYYRTFERITR